MSKDLEQSNTTAPSPTMVTKKSRDGVGSHCHNVYFRAASLLGSNMDPEVINGPRVMLLGHGSGPISIIHLAS